MKKKILQESFKSVVLGGVGSGVASAAVAFYLIGMPAGVVGAARIFSERQEDQV